MNAGEKKEYLYKTLHDAFCEGRGGAHLEIIDESYKHAGHNADSASGGTHYYISLRSPDFASMSRVARHRAVYEAIGTLKQQIHALRMDIKGV